eukprot:Gb_18349 [translate_table: standard]
MEHTYTLAYNLHSKEFHLIDALSPQRICKGMDPEKKSFHSFSKTQNANTVPPMQSARYSFHATYLTEYQEHTSGNPDLSCDMRVRDAPKMISESDGTYAIQERLEQDSEQLKPATNRTCSGVPPKAMVRSGAPSLSPKTYGMENESQNLLVNVPNVAVAVKGLQIKCSCKHLNYLEHLGKHPTWLQEELGTMMTVAVFIAVLSFIGKTDVNGGAGADTVTDAGTDTGGRIDTTTDDGFDTDAGINIATNVVRSWVIRCSEIEIRRQEIGMDTPHILAVSKVELKWGTRNVGVESIIVDGLEDKDNLQGAGGQSLKGFTRGRLKLGSNSFSSTYFLGALLSLQTITASCRICALHSLCLELLYPLSSFCSPLQEFPPPAILIVVIMSSTIVLLLPLLANVPHSLALKSRDLVGYAPTMTTYLPRA